MFFVFVPLFAGGFEIKEKIPAGTVLVMNRGMCDEVRFVFTSESTGVYQWFSMEHYKESDESQVKTMYEKVCDDKAFSYDGKTGRVKVDGDEICGVLVYIPEAKSWFMYDDSVVFVQSVLKARKLVSAWGADRFDKPKFIFYSDGKCKIDDIDGTYTQENGILRVSTFYSPSFMYFLQNGNKFYRGIAYLSEETVVK